MLRARIGKPGPLACNVALMAKATSPTTGQPYGVSSVSASDHRNDEALLAVIRRDLGHLALGR